LRMAASFGSGLALRGTPRPSHVGVVRTML
jgi:hypothetical protein